MKNLNTLGNEVMFRILLLTILLASCGQVPESSNYVAHKDCEVKPVNQSEPGTIALDLECPEETRR
jgi:hypothetical protein